MWHQLNAFRHLYGVKAACWEITRFEEWGLTQMLTGYNQGLQSSTSESTPCPTLATLLGNQYMFFFFFEQQTLWCIIHLLPLHLVVARCTQ